MTREKYTRAFLALAVLVGGPLLGAKLFDLIVLAGAWGANPPTSLRMMPYGKAWPVDTGAFFIPFSAALLIAGFGALIAGWRTPWRYRCLLCVPSVGILTLLVLTVVAFWPMNAALYYHGIASPKNVITGPQSIEMTRHWIQLDWLRVAGAAAAFFAALRALTLPWPTEVVAADPPIVRAILAAAVAARFSARPYAGDRCFPEIALGHRKQLVPCGRARPVSATKTTVCLRHLWLKMAVRRPSAFVRPTTRADGCGQAFND